MAKQPMARVVSRDASLEALVVSLGVSERMLLVDMDKLRLSKTYAQLKAQVSDWDDAARDEYALSLMAKGIA